MRNRTGRYFPLGGICLFFRLPFREISNRFHISLYAIPAAILALTMTGCGMIQETGIADAEHKAAGTEAAGQIASPAAAEEDGTADARQRIVRSV